MATINFTPTQGRSVRNQDNTGTYQTVANGTGTKSVQGTTYLTLSMNNTVVKNYINSDEAFMSFDFSSLPAGTINSASFFLTTGGEQGGVYDGPSQAYFIPYDWGATIGTEDYITGSAVASVTKYSTMTLTRAAIGTTYSSSATSNFLTDIANRSVMKLAVVLKTTVDVGTSGGSPIREDEIFYNYNFANASQRPKITVDYTPSSGVSYNLIVSPRLKYQQTILSSSPILYWRMNTTSGTTVTDYSGSARNGATVGSPTLETVGLLVNDSDTAITFDGSTQYATLAYASWMNTPYITLEAIIKPIAINSASIYHILDRDNSTSNPNRIFQFRINSQRFEITLWDNTGTLWVTTGSTTTITNGQTYHLAATYDGTTSKIYVNGKLEQSATRSGTLQLSGTRQLNVGTHISTYYRFPGVIDEVAWYSTPLSAETIAEHASVAGLF
jgi:hypothetical protein